MLSKHQQDLIAIQQQIIDEMLRSLLYYRAIHSITERGIQLTFIKGVLLKEFVILWCQVFGSKKENTHWSKLAGSQRVCETFSRTNLLNAGGLDAEGWERYHKQIKDLRDQFFVHFDMSSFSTHIPDLTAALNMCIEYRNWLIHLLETAIGNGQPLRIGFERTDKFLERINSEAAEFIGTA